MRSGFLKSSAVATFIAVSACSGGSPSSPSGSNAMTISITRQNGSQSFSPNPASAGGRVVVFKNNDSVVHSVRLNDGSIDTGNIAPGATSREVTMPASGTNYHCGIHPDMVGSVNASSGAPPPPCEGSYCGGDY
jgi:plastocyanin